MHWMYLILLFLLSIPGAKATPVYDPTDTFVKFYVHFHELNRLSGTGFLQHVHGSGTQVGSYIITNAHAVCLPNIKMSTVSLSFPTRLAYLDHFDADLDVGKRVIEMSNSLKDDTEEFQAIDPLFDALEKHAVKYKVYLPEGTECDGDSDHDLAILKPLQDPQNFVFATPSLIHQLDCRLPMEQHVSWFLGGGEVGKGQGTIDHQTTLGTLVVRDAIYNDWAFMGFMSPMYEGVQMYMPFQLEHLASYVRQLAKGDSGAAMIQLPCKDNPNANACVDQAMEKLLIPVDEDAHDDHMNAFLRTYGYSHILNPKAELKDMQFWGVAQGNGKLKATQPETSDFGVSFHQNKAFLQTTLPRHMLHESCY